MEQTHPSYTHILVLQMAFTLWVKSEAKLCAQILHQLCISSIFLMGKTNKGKTNKWNCFSLKQNVWHLLLTRKKSLPMSWWIDVNGTFVHRA
jgi:hypothetical protein